MAEQTPRRILHVLGGLDRGGIETLLMTVLRHIDRERFRMDFLIRTNRTCAYEEEARALGARILRCPTPRQPWKAAGRFTQLLREHGPYDVIHCHGLHYSNGLFLGMARKMGIPLRIMHSHNDSMALNCTHPLKKVYAIGYEALANYWSTRHATRGFACSELAATAMFGSRWQQDARWQVLFNGQDFSPFHAEVDRAEVCRELGIPPEAFIVGHVGRFAAQKNHTFFIQIADEIARRDPSVYFLLIGDGPLRAATVQEAAASAAAGRVIFAGVRPDVPRLMLGAMNAFLFPSRYEGLGLVLTEAQAAGVPCVVSDVIAHEAEVIDGLITRRSLKDPVAQWADAVLQRKAQTPPVSQQQACRLIEESGFNIHTCVRRLEEAYSGNAAPLLVRV